MACSAWARRQRSETYPEQAGRMSLCTMSTMVRASMRISWPYLSTYTWYRASTSSRA